MSVPLKGNPLPKLGKDLHPAPRRRRSTAYAVAVSEALRSQLNGSAHTTKTLMRWTGASERTVKGWLSGANGPCGEHLVELMANSDKVWDGFRRLAKRPAVEVRHLVLLKASLEAALASIDVILNVSTRQEGPG